METPTWLLDNPRLIRATEILLPVSVGTGASWRHPDGPGRFYAYLTVLPCPSGEHIWECDHDHPDRDSAWECAEDGAQMLAAMRANDVFERYVFEDR